MGKRGLHINPVGVLASGGLGLNLVWCTLMGHTLGFMSSAIGMETWVNPRLFFLAGILVFAVCFAGMPRVLKHADGMLRFVLPLLSAFGTACFGMSFHQTFFNPGVLAVGGLFIAGVGYFWLAARFCLLLARTQGYVCAVASIAGGLVVKLPVLLVLSAFASPNVQVVIAIIMPIATALLFETACAMARDRAERTAEGESASRFGPAADGPGAAVRARTVFGVPAIPRTRQHTSAVERRTMLVLLAIAAVVLAVIRSVSYLGMWGDTNANISTALPWFTAVVIPAACVAVFAYGALARMADTALPIRFQPALLLILVGLFVVAIQANPTGASLGFLTDVIQIDELFAHLLFWTVVVTALDVLDVPSYRVIGVAGTVYAGASIAWVVLLSRAAIVDTLLVMLATYAFVVVALCAVWFVPQRGGAGGALGGRDAGDEAPANEDDAAQPLARTVSDTCLEMAQRYGLSPRETEVFTLLAQGRTRAFIQDELVLSGSTIKTHVSHIYAKMDVHDRQEMMDLIWN